MVELAESGSLSLTGMLMAVLCCYVIFGRLVGMYVFDNTGGVRRRIMVQVVVLGDIGRSPRMRYHASSLADSGCTVDLIGYTDTNPGALINVNRHIRVRRIRAAWSVPKGYPKIFYLLWAPFKVMFTSVQLFWIMGCVTQRPDFVIVQNPPSLPTLIIARFVATLRKAWFIIDWHNFGYSILGMQLGKDHRVVRFAKWYERKYGSVAYAHLTVTDRMHKELKNEWKVTGEIMTLKDKPPSDFKRLLLEPVYRAWKFSLKPIVDQLKDDTEFWGKTSGKETATFMTDVDEDKGTLVWRQDRPRVIVSSTSWTEDEDFSILLKAVELYEAAAKPSDPRLLFIITGKGPLKAYYEDKISKMVLKKTRIITAWLEMSDYTYLLGSADLGISLHTSSSGMDLPMKVVDMFGCGLPVCAVNFECLDELVQDGKNGLVFTSSNDLYEQITDLRKNIIHEYATNTWQSQYKEVLEKLFQSSG
ncbi:glycosyltransferase family 33 protein [Backusella circina FSU 941]|nr:glycosyltransferase family 33 protein [Backusella circina FSU 941]